MGRHSFFPYPIRVTPTKQDARGSYQAHEHFDRTRNDVRATLRHMTSPDVYDLTTWHPPDSDFAILLQLLVGPSDGPGEESFDLTVCTPGWLMTRVQEEGIVDARHTLVVDAFDYGALFRFLNRRVSDCEGETWEAIAQKLSRLGHWEFEDYRE